MSLQQYGHGGRVLEGTWTPPLQASPRRGYPIKILGPRSTPLAMILADEGGNGARGGGEGRLGGYGGRRWMVGGRMKFMFSFSFLFLSLMLYVVYFGNFEK